METTKVSQIRIRDFVRKFTNNLFSDAELDGLRLTSRVTLFINVDDEKFSTRDNIAYMNDYLKPVRNEKNEIEWHVFCQHTGEMCGICQNKELLNSYVKDLKISQVYTKLFNEDEFHKQ
ncbi:hypothetical protein Molly5_54 [Maribacter phage Molly_5]|uniref:Uncharacterized protein n=1 Tax=Maribacter phage Molly_1 TaxID=2745685 RepID=A0A8E4UYE8_9CAUD|nr:hypothetical protein M1M29_gp054 [Maribacter phage Molly_1]QQO97738.1 hypothetical protein Molly2_54 [Maribacter phage Molly_2]QQO97938.1 hypothetical protein Molly3_54 [Maribacter phage Molly_3]QQO98138.1 hypothetical protein Molly4_54 [Maribacter phage Molly_4]QQO98338.1 hypothetical protein Molly5_54 [Maribacter phage Molly_5]QQO97538.1 hypothetical protein Molly1_54 [Maribacter phage Molly_1]